MRCTIRVAVLVPSASWWNLDAVEAALHSASPYPIPPAPAFTTATATATARCCAAGDGGKHIALETAEVQRHTIMRTRVVLAAPRRRGKQSAGLILFHKHNTQVDRGLVHVIKTSRLSSRRNTRAASCSPRKRTKKRLRNSSPMTECLLFWHHLDSP